MLGEILCVVYMTIFLAAITQTTCKLAHRKAFLWHTLQWNHVTHDIRGLGPGKLALMRLCMGIYAIATTVSCAWHPVEKMANGLPAVSGPVILATFTFWCWSLIGVYFIMSGLASALAAVRSCAAGGEEHEAPAGALGCLLWVFFEVMFACSVLVFFIVWTVLIPQNVAATGSPGSLLDFYAISAHNLNLLFMGIEMFVNRFSFVLPHGVFILYYGCAYIVFSWVWFWFNNQFFYFFIDWRSPLTPIGYTALIFVLWFFFWGTRRVADVVKRSAAFLLPGSDGFPLARDATGQVLNTLSDV